MYSEETPLINQLYLIEKYPGKGGWSYVAINEISPDRKAKFGWVQVKGSIDDFELKNYKLMPMGNGKLFLPIRAEIRKKINKQAGDLVKIVLYLDNDPIEIPEEILFCLNDDPIAKSKFFKLTESAQKVYIDWINSAKKVETKISRISTMLNEL